VLRHARSRKLGARCPMVSGRKDPGQQGRDVLIGGRRRRRRAGVRRPSPPHATPPAHLTREGRLRHGLRGDRRGNPDQRPRTSAPVPPKRSRRSARPQKPRRDPRAGRRRPNARPLFGAVEVMPRDQKVPETLDAVANEHAVGWRVCARLRREASTRRPRQVPASPVRAAWRRCPRRLRPAPRTDSHRDADLVEAAAGRAGG